MRVLNPAASAAFFLLLANYYGRLLTELWLWVAKATPAFALHMRTNEHPPLTSTYSSFQSACTCNATVILTPTPTSTRINISFCLGQLFRDVVSHCSIAIHSWDVGMNFVGHPVLDRVHGWAH